MKKFILLSLTVIIITFFQSCFKEEKDKFVNVVAFNGDGGTVVVSGEAPIYSLEIGEGDQMDKYHDESVEPDSIIVRSSWMTVKSRIGDNRLIFSVDPLNTGKKRVAPVSVYTQGYNYSVIRVIQYP